MSCMVHVTWCVLVTLIADPEGDETRQWPLPKIIILALIRTALEGLSLLPPNSSRMLWDLRSFPKNMKDPMGSKIHQCTYLSGYFYNVIRRDHRCSTTFLRKILWNHRSCGGIYEHVWVEPIHLSLIRRLIDICRIDPLRSIDGYYAMFQSMDTGAQWQLQWFAMIVCRAQNPRVPPRGLGTLGRYLPTRPKLKGFDALAMVERQQDCLRQGFTDYAVNYRSQVARCRRSPELKSSRKKTSMTDSGRTAGWRRCCHGLGDLWTNAGLLVPPFGGKWKLTLRVRHACRNPPTEQAENSEEEERQRKVWAAAEARSDAGDPSVSSAPAVQGVGHRGAAAPDSGEKEQEGKEPPAVREGSTVQT